MPKTKSLISFLSIFLGTLYLLTQLLPVVQCFGGKGEKSLEFVHINPCSVPDHSHAEKIKDPPLTNNNRSLNIESDNLSDCKPCIDVFHFIDSNVRLAFSHNNSSKTLKDTVKEFQSIASVPPASINQYFSIPDPPGINLALTNLQTSVLLI
jgi:hypothetical protein